MSYPNPTTVTSLAANRVAGLRLRDSATGLQVDITQAFQSGTQGATMGVDVKTPQSGPQARVITLDGRPGETFPNMRAAQRALRADGLA